MLSASRFSAENGTVTDKVPEFLFETGQRVKWMDFTGTVMYHGERAYVRFDGRQGRDICLLARLHRQSPVWAEATGDILSP